jgi:rhamnosyltransferase
MDNLRHPPQNPNGADGAPRVLVLLAAHNGEKWIQEQARSILEQDGVDVHLIIRDDGSSDDTPLIVRRLAYRDSRVGLLRADDCSGSASQNFFSLIRECDPSGFDFIALSDQDDVWDSDKLQQTILCIAMTHSAGASTAVTAIWPSGVQRTLRQNPATTASDYLFEGAGQGCTFVLSRTLYSRIRTFLTVHEDLVQRVHFHDWAIYALARSWNLPWGFRSLPTMRYRQHGRNDTGARSGVAGITLRIRRIRSGWYREQLIAISDICHTADPANSRAASWHRLLRSPGSPGRRVRLSWFCVQGGRRRVSDNVVLILSALAGWL